MPKQKSSTSRKLSAKEKRLEQWGRVEAGGRNGVTRLLAFDVSSTNVGWCVLHDRDPFQAGTIVLPKVTDLDVRLRALDREMEDLFWMFSSAQFRMITELDGMCYEGPAPEAKSGGWMNMVAQQQALGVVKAAWLSRLDPEVEHSTISVPIQHGKSALSGNWKATKEEMIRCAQLIEPKFVWSEHSADAFGIGLAAYGYLEQQRQVSAYDRMMREEANG